MQDIPVVKHIYFISRVEASSQSFQKHFQKQVIFKVVNSNFSCNETATFVQNFLGNLGCRTVFLIYKNFPRLAYSMRVHVDFTGMYCGRKSEI